MKRCIAWIVVLAAVSVSALATPQTEEQEEEEAVLDIDGVVVEAAIELRELQLHPSKPMSDWVEKLQLRDETQRALDLKQLHQSGISAMLELTRYSPIPLGASGPGPDTFFLQNYMRPDLNPRETDPLSLRR